MLGRPLPVRKPCSSSHIFTLLCRLVDKELAAKMEAEEVDYIQFAWRWINCLLLRELPFRLSLRLVGPVLVRVCLTDIGASTLFHFGSAFWPLMRSILLPLFGRSGSACHTLPVLVHAATSQHAWTPRTLAMRFESFESKHEAACTCSTPLQWDTYLAEDARMCEFLIYACGSFLVQWSKELMSMDFQEMIMFLQVIGIHGHLRCAPGLADVKHMEAGYSEFDDAYDGGCGWCSSVKDAA